MGSSPRVWGQGAVCVRDKLATGIIPTRVGTSRCSLRSYLSFQDHPHACGDKVSAELEYVPISGSSPRVWGQDGTPLTLTYPTGIIPTRVGTRLFGFCWRLLYQDHPHACGDKINIKANTFLDAGSSPRVWGQVALIIFGVMWLRIIPTRVGTSDKKHNLTQQQKDHPHACGDKVRLFRR